ncbi:hypothetical protein OFM04_35085, partial [Escherichia coli]|nr:hypothetical protein [Escherichia coli]
MDEYLFESGITGSSGLIEHACSQIAWCPMAVPANTRRSWQGRAGAHRACHGYRQAFKARRMLTKAAPGGVA